MENRYLGRTEAPLGAETWKLLDSTMIEAAKSQMAGRRILTIDGPFGFGLKVIPVNDCDMEEGISGSTFVPVNEIKSEFSLGKRDLASFEKDRLILDLGPVACAAIDCAAKEDQIIFHGVQGAPGLLTAEGSSVQTLTKWDKIGTAADQVIESVTKLDDAGFHGPYCMALAPSLYNLLLRRYPQGDGTELDHIRNIVTDGVVKAPVLKKGGVLLASGRQYATIVVGQDMTIAFNGPVGDGLDFYVIESLALLIRAPEAICILK
ncbi:MAG: bacteriocin family protein [Methanoregula sp.]|nr:bacteriocin family protein [Methanoregula sp.]